jgi:hypothetical protein
LYLRNRVGLRAAVAGPRPVLLEHDPQHLAAADRSATLDASVVGPSPQVEVEARLRLTSIAASAKVAVRPTSIPERRRSELPRIQCFIEAGYARRGAF